jgi:hypothetical protein
MAVINVGTRRISYPPNFPYEFRVIFYDAIPAGAPDTLFLEAMDKCQFNFDHRGHARTSTPRRPLVWVRWVAEEDLDLDPDDNFNTFARTTFATGPPPGQSISNSTLYWHYWIDILTDLHSRGGAFGGEAFYRECVAHELGHVIINLLTRDGLISEATLQAQLGPILGGLTVWNDPGTPWADRTVEAAAETFKDIYLPKSERVYSNRTNGKLQRANFDQFIDVIQGPHYYASERLAFHRFERDDHLWQQMPMEDQNERNRAFNWDLSFKLDPDISAGISGGYSSTWLADTFAWFSGSFNLWFDESKFDHWYLACDISDIINFGAWNPNDIPTFLPDGYYADNTYTPTMEIYHSYVGGANYTGAGANPNEADTEDYPFETTDHDPEATHWHLTANALQSHPSKMFTVVSADSGRTFLLYKFPLLPEMTFCFLQWNWFLPSNIIPNDSMAMGEGWGELVPFAVLPHPAWPESLPSTVLVEQARRGVRRERRHRVGAARTTIAIG